MILDPVPAYVIKTLDMSSGEKIFINVCTDTQINPPNTLDAGEIAIQVTRGQDWIVPIVVSRGRDDKDKAGKPSFVVDCCMNPSVVLLGIEDPSVKVLTVETCIELVEERFGRVLSRDYKFPKMKSKGTLERTEVDLNQPQLQSRDMTDIVATKNSESAKPAATASVQVIKSSESSPFYMHVYRGNYKGTGPRPSHVVEIEGEHHDIKIANSIITMGDDTLKLQFEPQQLEGFYSSNENCTYIMLWK